MVEDSTAISKVMTRWLEANGCDVTTAMNGLLGLNELISRTNNLFDVVITDFLMVSRMLLLLPLLLLLLYQCMGHCLVMSTMLID